ncbi:MULTISPECIES: tRNA (guanosine(46)-N7)-methyltransferase TrmB [Thiorhodovibrio]|uniref:tRNA (guanosine(46)-N7)-methyltransferase TrmB n=1 Tax=Thiorhodovibrio TaxID=61593 RepID=UPI0019143E61|nr:MULTISPECIES: tRNA (guanosine(46)-N7)-methyltransferase TrmB [Thiorhodovibrio]WPL11664.1 tRNA (guanine-N(7)-)-methyltransferase [Thiorhodovibrio litoralis]
MPADIRRRPVRSFVLREGRLTAAQARAFETLWPRYGLNWQPDQPLDLPALFGNDHPVVLEIGFGNGEAMLHMAARHPKRNYLGLEVHRPGIGHLLRELERVGLGNVRVMREDATALLARGLKPASLAGVCLFFPDPWPKKRHHKRRIVQPAFVDELARVIASGGFFHAATDWLPYAEWMLEHLCAAGDRFENLSPSGDFIPRPDDRPPTRFERRGERLGQPARDLWFRRR